MNYLGSIFPGNLISCFDSPLGLLPGSTHVLSMSIFKIESSCQQTSHQNLTEHITNKIKASDAVLLWRVMESFNQDLKNKSHAIKRMERSLFLKNYYDLINCIILLPFQWNCFLFVEPDIPPMLHTVSVTYIPFHCNTPHLELELNKACSSLVMSLLYLIVSHKIVLD
jgi:hypothetical protein